MSDKMAAVLIGVFFLVSALFLEKYAIDFIFSKFIFSKQKKIRLKNGRREMSNDNCCIFCGEQIPEGMQVCPNHTIPFCEESGETHIDIDSWGNKDLAVAMVAGAVALEKRNKPRDVCVFAENGITEKDAAVLLRENAARIIYESRSQNDDNG